MPPPFDHAFAGDLPAPYDRVYSEAATFVPASRLITDPLRLLTWGSDASFYRLVPKIVVVVESEDELVRLLALCARWQTPVTFRAAGTSLSGQAISDSVLVMLGRQLAWLHARRGRRNDHAAARRHRRRRPIGASRRSAARSVPIRRRSTPR